ncbi:hypothetical protein D1818_01810 [Aquimarina sp. BL5]|uniref:DUF6268 family outer membrane beta-barrel protein n=1 Tax=Aquimarina sp. BL5 TaxID=1714860 RepID=UPI000E4D9101|nr:DUF6268 family outer membrane beta-barrel protein [Aquimarina sp. BL5]AXT49615.1 hypothetical protein D1818_01810 [Aquimarina sp. BL5]RKN05436.1 hypothetical protein D7036_10660 [Aquimarina sp. BL5]
MKKLIPLVLLVLFSFLVHAQDYTDIVRLNISRVNLEDVEQTFDTDITNINFELLYPKVLNDKFVLLTGITAENTHLNLSQFATDENLTMTRVNAGVKVKHSEKWSGTYVVLPKLASNFEEVGSRDFQFGAIALLDFQYNEKVRAKFGLYSSSENFGTIITPLLGAFYKSPNKKFHIDAVLPIRIEANYMLANHFSLGFDLRTSVKSYNLVNEDIDFYVQEESVRAAFYTSYGLLNDSLLLRAKLGFDTTDYGLYVADDKVGVQVLTFALDGDDRTRLNNEFDSSLFFGLDFIYRFDISGKQ